MAKPSNPLMDVILYGFLIFVALVGAWLIEPQLLGTACPSLPRLVQRGLNCR
jgi:hypothetical protein